MIRHAYVIVAAFLVGCESLTGSSHPDSPSKPASAPTTPRAAETRSGVPAETATEPTVTLGQAKADPVSDTKAMRCSGNWKKTEGCNIRLGVESSRLIWTIESDSVTTSLAANYQMADDGEVSGNINLIVLRTEGGMNLSVTQDSPMHCRFRMDGEHLVITDFKAETKTSPGLIDGRYLRR
ncbi:MAG: hypothetical protein K2R98_15445 [Gemmataceae bacterium]|nr:hypothetical protein [Gemmataceae bacterium]